MDETIEITADRLMEMFPITRRTQAEHIAQYASVRLTGARPIDAMNEVGIGSNNIARYERWLQEICARLGLDYEPHETSRMDRTAEGFARGRAHAAEQLRARGGV